MSDARVLCGKFYTSVLGIFRCRVSGGAIAFSAISISAFLGVSVTPLLLHEDTWISPASSIAILKASWPAILGGLWLQYGDKFRSNRAFKSMQGGSWTSVQLGFAQVIAKIETPNNLAEAQREHAKLQSLRENILHCAAESVMLELQLDQHDIVVASLCDQFGPEFKNNTRSKSFFISARSRPLPIGHGYKRAQMLAYSAMDLNEVMHANRTRKSSTGNRRPLPDPERGTWPRLSDRDYQALMALPIIRDGDPLGSICLDCTRAYAFSGKNDVVRTLLQPYVAALMRTYPTKSDGGRRGEGDH